MTKLEKEIYECALKIMPEMQKEIESKTWEVRYVKKLFECNGVFDIITYDNKLKRFTQIEYQKGNGNPSILFGNRVGVFDDIDVVKFDIPDEKLQKRVRNLTPTL